MDGLKMTDYEIFILLSIYLETHDFIIVKDAFKEDNYIHKCEYNNNHLNLFVSDLFNNIRKYNLNEYSKTFRLNLINKLKSLNLDINNCWND